MLCFLLLGFRLSLNQLILVLHLDFLNSGFLYFIYQALVFVKILFRAGVMTFISHRNLIVKLDWWVELLLRQFMNSWWLSERWSLAWSEISIWKLVHCLHHVIMRFLTLHSWVHVQKFVPLTHLLQLRNVELKACVLALSGTWHFGHRSWRFLLASWARGHTISTHLFLFSFLFQLSLSILTRPQQPILNAFTCLSKFGSHLFRFSISHFQISHTMIMVQLQWIHKIHLLLSLSIWLNIPVDKVVNISVHALTFLIDFGMCRHLCHLMLLLYS